MKKLRKELLALQKEFKDSLYWTNYDQRRLNNTNKSNKIKENENNVLNSKKTKFIIVKERKNIIN